LIEYGIEYKEERSAELRLRVFRGPLDLSTFPVIARRAIRSTRFAVDACIIGASHAVQLHMGNEILTEVLACGPDAVQRHKDQLVGMWPLGEAVEPLAATGIAYSFTSELVSLEDAEESLASLRLASAEAAGVDKIGLSFRFPSANEMRAPETLLWAGASDGAVSVWSAHVYPAEEVAVFSKSRIALPEPASRINAERELIEV
jgi:hypothetical protein